MLEADCAHIVINFAKIRTRPRLRKILGLDPLAGMYSNDRDVMNRTLLRDPYKLFAYVTNMTDWVRQYARRFLNGEVGAQEPLPDDIKDLILGVQMLHDENIEFP